MAVRTCDILTYALHNGDATSQHTFELARTLAAIGIRPTIHSHLTPRDLPTDIRPIAQQTAYAAYTPAADLMILQYPLWFPLAERFRQAQGARVFWYHGVTPPEHWPVPEERDLLRTSQVRTELANYAHLSVAASPFTAAELRLHARVPADRLRIVPLGVDIDAFSAQPNAAELRALRKRWKLDGKRVLLYVGRIAGNKRIDLLIDALAHLSRDHADLHALIVGDDSDGVATQALASSLRKQAHELGVARRITFTGRVAELAPYYHLAHLFVQPSQHEGFGVPLVESMAAGTPVIASASGAMPWLLGAGHDSDAGDGMAGLLFSPGDAGDLAGRIAELLSRPARYEQLVARGRQRAQVFNQQTFRARAAVTVCEAIELHAASASVPEATQDRSALYAEADTMLRDFVVPSRLPVLGQRIAWARTAATVHFKEAYFDRVMEQQVSFNRALAAKIEELARAVDESSASHTAEKQRP